MRKLSRFAVARAEGAINLASLGPSNEQTSCQSTCVCVYHLQDGMCTSAESLWSVGCWAVMGPCGAVGRDGPLSFQ